MNADSYATIKQVKATLWWGWGGGALSESKKPGHERINIAEEGQEQIRKQKSG